MLQKIFSNDEIDDNLLNHLEENFPFRSVAFYVEDEKINWFFNFEKKVKTIKCVLNPKCVSETFVAVVCVGNGKMQNDVKCIYALHQNVEINFIQFSLNGVAYLLNAYQTEKDLCFQNNNFNVFFCENSIKKSDFSQNLGVYSYLLSRYVFLFEKEFYAKIFNTNAELMIKKQLYEMLSKLKGLLNKKIENFSNANMIVLDCLKEYLLLFQKYSVMQEVSSVEYFAVELTGSLFSDPFENCFISSVFLTSLYEKYFKLSFQNSYCFDYYKKVNLLPEKWSEKISEFSQNKITKELCYKLQANQNQFSCEVVKLQNILTNSKYDFLGMFSDFGYGLLNNLKKCNIKRNLEISAEKSERIMLSQIRNFGMLDF